jgi:hypothetical protein
VYAWVSDQHLTLAPYRAKNRLCKGGNLRKWWNEKQVPAFLRQVFPLIYGSDEVKHEFLSGNSSFDPFFAQKKIKISLKKELP